MRGLRQKRTFITICALPPGAKGIPTKFVFKVKLDAHGNLIKYKARLVAQGFHQIEGVDFTQSYAPVAHAAAVRMLMAIATMMQMPVSHVDISQAFLQAPLTETVYCLPPCGFESAPGEAYSMLVSLYGL